MCGLTMLTILAAAVCCAVGHAVGSSDAPAFAVVQFQLPAFAPQTFDATKADTFDLLPAGDLERTPRDYLAVTATVTTQGISRAALRVVDILNREYDGEMVKLARGEKTQVSLDIPKAAGHPLAMLRAVKLILKGQPVEVLGLRFACAVEKLPQPDAVVSGTMDDTSIQAALDSLPDTGGVLYIPAGTYAIANTVTIPSGNVTIYGDGPRTVLHGTWDGAEKLIVAENAENLRLTRLHVRSLGDDDCRTHEAFVSTRPERRHPSSVLKIGIELRGCTNARVDHCEVELFGNVGIMFEGGTDNLVDHCFVHDYFPYGTGYGIGARGTARIYIEDNNVENHRHNITTYKGCERSFVRFNRLVKDPYVVPEWYDDPKSITYLSSYPVNAHPDCGWVCVNDNYIAMTTGLMWSAAEMRGNSGWLYRNLIRACTIGIMCRDTSTAVWAWDNTFIAATQEYGSSASGDIHFNQQPPDFTETPYPYALSRMGWWPGANQAGLSLVKPSTQFAGPQDAPALTAPASAE